MTQSQFARICRVNHGGPLLGFCHDLPNLQDTVLQDTVLKDSMHKRLYAVIGQTLAWKAPTN
jgi:hypothetical protein